jgi:hypothetical protein
MQRFLIEMSQTSAIGQTCVVDSLFLGGKTDWSNIEVCLLNTNAYNCTRDGLSRAWMQARGPQPGRIRKVFFPWRARGDCHFYPHLDEVSVLSGTRATPAPPLPRHTPTLYSPCLANTGKRCKIGWYIRAGCKISLPFPVNSVYMLSMCMGTTTKVHNFVHNSLAPSCHAPCSLAREWNNAE